jgi:16S rRNA processing protein RimM
MRRQYLELGKIVGTHGVRGEMRVQPWCDSPAFFQQFHTLYFSRDGESPATVVSCRPHGNVMLVKLGGIDTMEAAATLRGRVLFMNRGDVTLAEGDYFIQDLIGCRVTDADTGRLYGTLTDVSATGANDVWHVQDDSGKEYLLPAIPPVVVKTDVDREEIRIRPLKGIFDEAEEVKD